MLPKKHLKYTFFINCLCQLFIIEISQAQSYLSNVEDEAYQKYMLEVANNKEQNNIDYWQDIYANYVPEQTEDFYINYDSLNNKDSDGDGLTDRQELSIYFTDPIIKDTDRDGLSDGEEILTFLTDPLNADSDFDLIKDGDEVSQFNTKPNVYDTDGDQLSDGKEIFITNTNPLKADSDGGGIDDRTEIILKLNPLDALDDINAKLD